MGLLNREGCRAGSVDGRGVIVNGITDVAHWRPAHASGLLGSSADGLHATAVSAQRIVRGEQCFSQRQLHAGCVLAISVTKLQEDLRLVDGHPVGDAIREALDNLGGVLAEPLCAIAIEPATAVVEGEGEVPMKERDPRLNAVCEE